MSAAVPTCGSLELLIELIQPSQAEDCKGFKISWRPFASSMEDTLNLDQAEVPMGCDVSADCPANLRLRSPTLYGGIRLTSIHCTRLAAGSVTPVGCVACAV
jgi:hypothetical protein